ncbi:small conductance mechanosensitive channel [Filimonas zeae]|uniref:Mechanosensitive ion channel protein MscS n=1 Tax=Filimonas zeae TaxID=1737353 RepID=A0A917J399_9BACT|nr:mechanosensitive ion channel family protein [Filimonas zeae]MDR6341860.1 small conductance mechanosensitive channel [Filimonas zeae]GGH80052.1 mechanosensitive ion channel protein MscS [Filimonas zeae]
MPANIDKLYDKAYDWVITFGPRIIIALVVLLLGQWLIRFIRKRMTSSMNRRSLNPSLQPFMRSLISGILQILLVLLLMQILGIQLTIFAALVGALGVAAGLALSGTLQNFTSGILILIMKPYTVGDNVIAQGQEGTVTDIRVFYTVLTTYDNRTVIIPNSKLSNELIINLSSEGKRRMDIEMKLPYPVDFKQAESILREVVESDDRIMKDPATRIGVSVIEPDGYKMIVNAWVNAHGFHDVRLQLQQKMIDALKGNGVKLPGM